MTESISALNHLDEGKTILNAYMVCVIEIYTVFLLVLIQLLKLSTICRIARNSTVLLKIWDPNAVAL